MTTGAEPTRAEVMCTLCGSTGVVDTNTDTITGRLTALSWALHFKTEHPDLGLDSHASEHLILVEAEGGEGQTAPS